MQLDHLCFKRSSRLEFATFLTMIWLFFIYFLLCFWQIEHNVLCLLRRECLNSLICLSCLQICLRSALKHATKIVILLSCHQLCWSITQKAFIINYRSYETLELLILWIFSTRPFHLSTSGWFLISSLWQKIALIFYIEQIGPWKCYSKWFWGYQTYSPAWLRLPSERIFVSGVSRCDNKLRFRLRLNKRVRSWIARKLCMSFWPIIILQRGLVEDNPTQAVDHLFCQINWIKPQENAKAVWCWCIFVFDGC